MNKKFILHLYLLIGFIVFFVPGRVLAGSATITWNANTEPDLAGYKIYYGTSPRTGTDPKVCGLCGYTTSVNAGNVLTYTFNNLADGQTYYFSVTAYDTSNNESVFSSEVSKTTVVVDTTAPIISAITASSITQTGATIAWTTNELADTQVEYGQTTSYGLQTTLNSLPVTSHSTVLSGLSSGTLYHYRVKSRDAAGNLAQSADFTFTTQAPPAPDTTPPAAVTDLTPQNITQTSVDLVTWTAPGDDGNTGTAFAYDLRYSTGTLTSANFSAASAASGLPTPLPAGSRQSYVLVGLTPGTTYTAALKTRDEVPNWSDISNIVTFTTLPATPSPDTQAPSVPTNLSAIAVSATQVNLSWTASTDNVGVTGYRIYRGGAQIGTSAGPTYTDASGLSGGQTYSYTVAALDAAGNVSAQSAARSVTTPLAPDTTAPTVSFTAPSSGATVSGTTVAISATAADPTVSGQTNSGIANVVFKVDGATISTDTTQPYTVSWNSTSVANGSHSLTAQATDNSGNVSLVASVTVTVNNAAPPPAAPTLSVTLSASPVSGQAPLSGVSLTAVVSGTASGNINYYFYCNRSDANTDITSATANLVNLAVAAATQTANSLCSYTTAGTYTAKVIVERSTAPAAEARVNITVSAPPPPTTPPAPPSTGGGGGGGGGGGISDVTAPPAVANAIADGLDGQIVLSWDNPPQNTDYVRTVIIRKEGSTALVSPTDGILIYEGTGNNFIDTGLVNGKVYSYSIYTIDRVPNYSSPVVIAATPQAGKTQTNILSNTQSQPSQVLRLINHNGTFYLIKNGQRLGIANPGILFSYGFSFDRSTVPTPADLSLPEGPLLTPADGALVKSQQDPTVYLISGQKRYAFTSSQVFLGLGFKWSSILVVTNPELQSLPREADLNNSQAKHLPGLNILKEGTVYWIGYDDRLHPYPSLKVYNSWHIANDFSRVVPANAADMTLPIGEFVSERVLE